MLTFTQTSIGCFMICVPAFRDMCIMMKMCNISSCALINRHRLIINTLLLHQPAISNCDVTVLNDNCCTSNSCFIPTNVLCCLIFIFKDGGHFPGMNTRRQRIDKLGAEKFQITHSFLYHELLLHKVKIELPPSLSAIL